MRSLVIAVISALVLVYPAIAQEVTDDRPLVTQTDDLEQFLWIARPVVVFADTANDPRFIQQMDLLNREKDALFRRDVVVLTDTDPDAESELRRQLRPHGFSLVVIGKDGQVELRKPSPWHVRELTRAIDKMPLRQQEMREQRRGEG
ncbi:DUF4174 domain-containing protein [Qingshengfaniella alkalisoli]|uniref:DUF4174 domain-containing protein n=1 Tax=Qingshengfaniella alkalisoli TaxID=2599296 RepID=A0A5B8IXE0_9RHOB|nr:DUF4174 domain-containing protein [Qingshengfaniella alkalisoli]QDY69571.1 DUF4174 domain-containing protein [Qingshengfaniella alkalisoli]